MARPRTSSTSSYALDEFIAQSCNAILKLIVGLCVPLGALGSGHSILSGKGDVEDIILIVAAITIDALAVTGRGERDGCLPDDGIFAIITVCVAPDAVYLQDQLVDVPKEPSRTHANKLIATDHGHDAQGLNAILLRIELFPPGFSPVVAKDDIRMNIGVKVPLASAVALYDPLKGRRRLCVPGAAAAAVVGRAPLDAVAVNIHVYQLAILALEVDDVVVGDVVAAVVGVCVGQNQSRRRYMSW